MSWTKRPQGGAVPPSVPERQPYASPQTQPFGNQDNMYPNFQGGGAGTVHQQQQFWQLPVQQEQQPQYNQQYSQVYQQQDYPVNANQFYQQSNSYNDMNYANQGFNNTQQVRYPQQNYYQNPIHENQGQNFLQPKSNVDSWEDNWDWGWGEDSSKQSQKAPQNIVQQTPSAQQQVFNNANIIEESFIQTDSNCWNWAMEEKKESKEPLPQTPNHEPPILPISNSVQESNALPEVTATKSVSNMSVQQAEEVRTLNDRDVKERLPNLALGKRFHLDNLTPQWSIESQMSQESSDGLHTQSEGTYRSDNQSRNSSKSSPGLNTDNSNFNYSQVGLDEGLVHHSEWSRPSDQSTLADNSQSDSRKDSHDELLSSMQEMSLSNHENHSKDGSHSVHEAGTRSIQEVIPATQPLPAVSPISYPTPSSTTAGPSLPPAMPPPPVSSLPPPASTQSSMNGPPPMSSMPPPNFPPPTSSSNPFKHAGPFSHKTLAKGSPSAPSLQTLPPQMTSTNLASPAVVSKLSQHSRVSGGFEANLETTPDNSERPDQPQVSAFRPMPVSQPVPDNMEVAPRNDRNEYLQTAHLSSSDFGENTNFSRGIPGNIRRMVVGQQESAYSQNLNVSADEPPPGLDRMVPGQQTEVGSGYNQPSDNYLVRHIDGQTTENSARPYRQAEGQQTPENYTQPSSNRVTERRPVGLDRMVPGEPSNDEYSQYQGSNYTGTNEQRIVTGVDHDFAIPPEVGPSDVREQNVDGSDYTETSLRNPPRNVIGARESSNNVSPDFTAPPDDQLREVTMEGENLQDLSNISSTELTFSRFSEQGLDGAHVTHPELANDQKTDLSDSINHQVSSSRRQSLNRVNTSGDDSERDRAFKASPRRDRDKHKASRDRDRERDRDRDKDGRYSRGDRKYDPDRRSVRDDRRGEKDRRDRDGYRERRERDDSPDARRHRRSTRSHRYEADDTDYYSDRERDRRRHREGSYASKPPRPDDKEWRYDEHDRSKRYNTIERERRHDDERESRRRSDRYRYERAYRDIDPNRKYASLRRTRDKDERRGEYSPSRPDSRGEATATDDDGTDTRRRDRRSRRTVDPFYDEYGGDPYLAQRQQYQYYEQLRLTNPAAYMAVYKQLMAGHAPPVPVALYGDELGAAGYEARASVHSGRSSAAGLHRTDPDLTTDISLNLHEDSTVRSERMTPFRYSTAHIKGSVSSRDVVVVRAAYPVDGAPATVHVLALAAALQHDPLAAELAAFPGPLLKGVTHKKSVVEYCGARARAAAAEGARDATGYVLLWELLALMLRQNGVVVGSDIAELLMKNTREYELKTSASKTHNESRRGSTEASSVRDDDGSASPAAAASPTVADNTTINQEPQNSTGSTETDPTSLEMLRELLTYGNRQEAIECAIARGLWGHALALAAFGERRARAGVAARFVAALPRADPLHTLYAALSAAQPPAATCVADERWGDWRPHAAMMLSNPSAKPDQDRRTLTQMGDSLNSRGLLYSAQFCFLAAGVELARHPLAPLQPLQQAPVGVPRLALLLADPRCTSLQQLASNRAIFATEVYEYAMSLSRDDYVITELQAYKLVLACRLVDCGRYERALAYAEAAARAVTAAPRLYSPALVARLAALADRLQYHDPALHEDAALVQQADSAEPSPRHQQWLADVQNVALMLSAESAQQSAHASPQHAALAGRAELQQAPPYPRVQQPPPTFVEPAAAPDYPAPYHPPQAAPPDEWPRAADQPQQYADQPQQYSDQPQQYADQHQQYADQPQQYADQPQQYADQPQQYADQHQQYADQHQQYADPYWHADNSYGGYTEAAGGAELRASITMPGANKPRAPLYDIDDDRPPSADQTERDTDTPQTAAKKQEARSKDEGSKGDGKNSKGGWLGGILTKLSLRAPNQMILPDDKNPSIVWDPDSKRWRDVDGDADQPDLPPPPPPRTSDLLTLQSAAAAPMSNIFKMQKGRHIKKAYVDVFNPRGAAPRPLPPAAELQPPAAPAAYFVPQNSMYDPSRLDNGEDPYRSGI